MHAQLQGKSRIYIYIDDHFSTRVIISQQLSLLTPLEFMSLGRG